MSADDFITEARGWNLRPKPDTDEGQVCKRNSDCTISACCVQGQCANGHVCFSGFKVIEDFCEANYECQSRCCKHEQCSNPKQC